MAISSALGSSALLPAGLGFRNVLINGDFRINQRGYASGTSLAVGAYGFDRWKVAGGLSTALTFTAAPQGQMITISTANGQIRQIIERANVTPGTYVLSWEGTVSGRVYNEGGSSTGYVSSPITVVLDGTANVIVEFITQPGVTSTLWKPQLERNSQPTPFENRPIGVELALCQRYFQICDFTVEAPYASGSGQTMTYRYPFPVPMRATPTMSSVTGVTRGNCAGESTFRVTPRSHEQYAFSAGAGGFYSVGGTVTASIEL